MSTILKRDLEVDRRTIIQNATLAIRDVYDAIVELVTNADDRYQVLGKTGLVEIERRRGQPSILRVRDFADGMTSEAMELKLSRMGGRVSGMEQGLAVRGTNSRGAKDVAALGQVSFESIASDGKLHTCRITPFFSFELDEPREATKKERNRLGLHEGTGTVVTIWVDAAKRVPIHEKLLAGVASLVRLRDIIRQKHTTIIVRDLQQGREDLVSLPHYSGTERLSQKFSVPGYPGVEAKLVIHRADKKFKPGSPRFRLGGILVKSRHAIHEATLFDPGLESDPSAARFYGRLTCEAIDDLWNEFDERYEKQLLPLESNPVPILDPSRKSGLTRGHPAVAALYKEALKRLRPLVEEERRREQTERSHVESRETRKRLDALEKAANQFMSEYSDEEDTSRDPEGKEVGSRFREQGYSLSPPFAQIVVGHSRRCWLSVLQEVFPEMEVGDSVQIECLTSEIQVDRRFAPLESHPNQEGVLRATWSVKALDETAATGFRARVGPIVGESMIAVIRSEADRYAGLEHFEFQRKRYRIRAGSRKRIRLLAPLDLVGAAGRRFSVELEGSGYRVSGATELEAKENLGVAMADISVSVTRDDAQPGKLIARLGDHVAQTEVVATPPEGAGITIKLEDVDHGAYRYRWKKNVLEIAARHASLARYLGPNSEQFPGQEERHFRVLIAEIVADAVCSELLRHNIQANPADYENADWDLFYHEFSEYMSTFLPKAHALVVPDAKPSRSA